MSSAILFPKIQFKLLNERLLSNGELCTSKYVTLTWSFHRVTLLKTFSLPIPYPSFSDSSFKTDVFSRFLKVVIAVLNFMKEVYKSRFALEFSVSVLKEISALFRRYLHETRT